MPQPEWRQRLGLGEKEGRALLQLLLSRKICRLSRNFVAAKDFRLAFSPRQRQCQSEIERRLARSGYRPVPVADLLSLGPEVREILKALQGKSLAFLSPEFVLSKACLRRAAEVVTQYFKEHEVLKVGTLRDLLKVNRRQALLILTYFDGLGLTVKAGDGRAAGSRAANDTAKGDDVYE